jgi:hypothetical protein
MAASHNFGLRLVTLAQLGVFAPTWATAQEPGDSAFAELQARGTVEMGVDQSTAIHRFDDLPDGGRIELQTSRPDSSAVSAIRGHLEGIARAFGTGDFSKPSLVHARDVPGAATMSRLHRVISYRFEPLPRGGAVRIRAKDPEALQAIHQFLAFQRREHRAGGQGHL